MRDNNRIILAENEKDILIPLKTIFELNGYEVIITDKVKDLLPLVQSTNAKWMILDVELTDGTSITEIPKIKNEIEDIFIFLLIGDLNRQKELEFLNSGANIILRKPYLLPEIILVQLQKNRNYFEGNNEKTSIKKSQDL